MAEAEDEPIEEQAGEAGEDEDIDLASAMEGTTLDPEMEATMEEAVAAHGPGFIGRTLRWLARWHPFIFLGASLVLAGIAWMVYPEPAVKEIPSAESLYQDGLDRLYRVINPDLPLIAPTPADEALAARNAFLNLLVLHRQDLNRYPRFINPHLLLAEANRILAEFNPAMAEKYYQDAFHAYTDAVFWETREDDAARLAIYVNNNFLDARERLEPAAMGVGGTLDFFDVNNDEIALRRARRLEYIRYRAAEANINLGRPEQARADLEEIRRGVDSQRRENLRRALSDDMIADDMPRRAFELGRDEYRNLDLLLARTYDGMGQLARARSWYLRYLAAVPGGRDHAFVVGRLADIEMGDGEVYRRVNAETAARAYEAAVRYYTELTESPSATREQRDGAVFGLATANSRLADLVPAAGMTGVDELSRMGRTARSWLEDFSGQPLPRRTLALAEAVGKTLARPEFVVPGVAALPGVAAGNLAAMAGGEVETPNEKRRLYRTEALRNFDRLALIHAGSEEGDRATVAAAWESWSLGQKADAEARWERMLDPLSSEDLILAARLGLATAALDRGDPRKAHMLVLGGYAHPSALWFTDTDADWRKIAAILGNPRNRREPGVWSRVWEMLPEEGREIASYAASGRRLDNEYVARLLRAMNTMIRRKDFHDPVSFPGHERNFHLRYILNRPTDLLTGEDVVWRNRLLLEEAWPYDLSQRAAKNNVGFESFPPARELLPGGLVQPERVRDLLIDLGAAWAGAATRAFSPEERLRMVMGSVDAYRAALDMYDGDPGRLLYEQARNYETLAEIREGQGDHREALSLTATAARAYLDVSLRARGSPREMDALLAAGDAFFRAGLLERTVESQLRFLDRFGYSSLPGTDGAMAVARAENLLGRAYWFLSDTESALAAFKRNLPRRTPGRFNSIYYIGRIMMEEGAAGNNAALLGDPANPLPQLDRNGDPIIESALQAFNFLRQSPGIAPEARAWRWATFDLGRLYFVMAERLRRQAEDAERNAPAPPDAQAAETPWIPLYDTARMHLTEALERYPLRRNGGVGLSVRVEPEDYADTMAGRFETEYSLAHTLLTLYGARGDEALASLARAHLENLRDNHRYAGALFDSGLDRFQLNAAVIREEVEGGVWDRAMPLPRTRLGDDEGPTHSPVRMRGMLANAMLLLGEEYFQAGERAARRQLLASSDASDRVGSQDAAGFYRRSYEVWQNVYDRFGLDYAVQAMVRMGDSLSRLGHRDDAANHYRMARNIADIQPDDARSDGYLDIGPAFWGGEATNRLRDLAQGYTVP